ncbi:MAG: LuxR C-terminal-related transcriptional regulator [Lentilitoribacter sp.]
MSMITTDFLSDIDNAVNNLDFYRLYKVMCRHYHIDMLALLDLNTWPDDNNINAACVAIDSSDGVPANLNVLTISEENMIFSHAKSSIVPKIWTQEETAESFDFYDGSANSCAVTFPIHSATSRHYVLVGLLQKSSIKKLPLAEADYHSSLIFQKYHETVLVPSSLPTVTPRELQVLKWSAEGKTSQEIAVILSLSEHTVNSYTARVQQKLQVNNRAQMVAAAIRTGLIQ